MDTRDWEQEIENVVEQARLGKRKGHGEYTEKIVTKKYKSSCGATAHISYFEYGK